MITWGRAAADLGHEALDGLLERMGGEGPGSAFAGVIRHARIAVAEQHDLVVADDLGGLVELSPADLGDIGADLRRVHGGIQDLAFLAPGAGDKDGVHTCGVIPGDGARSLGRLVVGVRVHAQEAESLVHGWPR